MGIQNRIKYDYTSTILPGQVTVTGAGKLAGGVGMRLEYNFESRAYFMISGMILDKGFSIVFGENVRIFPDKSKRYRPVSMGIIIGLSQL